MSASLPTPGNPPAFPLAAEGPNSPHFAEGMTLRDYFAGQALAGFAALSDADGEPLMGAKDTARAAYNYADAMLTERAKADGRSE